MNIPKDSWWLRRGRAVVLSLLVLWAAGLVMSLVERPVWREVKSHLPELNLSEVEGALGQGLIIGLLGGFRTIIADFLYIRGNFYWENQDRAKTETTLNLVTAIDPRPMFFWTNGARIIAYDIPVWRIRSKGGWDEVPDSVQQRLREEQAFRGLEFIDRAAAFHPNDYRVPLEKAMIYNNRLDDKTMAAEYYYKVWQMEHAPFYAGRIYAELLRQTGREREAYAHLRAIYPTLPPPEEVPAANRPVVLERIRELEEVLDLPFAERLPVQPEERPADRFQLGPRRPWELF